MSKNNRSHLDQIVQIVHDIEVHGHCTIPVADLLGETEKFLKKISGVYYTFLPAHSINYVIARSAPNGMPDSTCTVGCLGDYNRYQFQGDLL
jgi:hypothetical protein